MDEQNSILERLKSPVVWSVFLTTLYAQIELWQTGETSFKTVALGILLVLVATFGAINNPTDRDNM